jgi:hypothetical protein
MDCCTLLDRYRPATIRIDKEGKAVQALTGSARQLDGLKP